ncbi:hypothetical protein Pcinc_012064 [Petrolisthes cinctipes]|uniref:Uncharacterized protein n=1 Tax=Petrolisthes cinctipes TaxID=88211 RepID=A0AAE1G5K4_PETCI|nr:hypothetical protein Pcinc_012064 [Petrolisthes cinctipes]
MKRVRKVNQRESWVSRTEEETAVGQGGGRGEKDMDMLGGARQGQVAGWGGVGWVREDKSHNSACTTLHTPSPTSMTDGRPQSRARSRVLRCRARRPTPPLPRPGE